MKCNTILRSLVLIGTLLSLIESRAVTSEASAVDYLINFGYLAPQDPRTGALRTEESFTRAITEFQEFAGLNVTGQLDDTTITLMRLPRCGVADKIGPGLLARRKKRYTIQGSSWPKQALTYKIRSYSRHLPNAQVDDILRRALKVWSDVTPLEFRASNSRRVDIDIEFKARAHGDGNPFDGKGRVLAHAFFPQFGGDAHFDEDESWTTGSSEGTNLFQVAAHEFGHSLGLSHSQDRNALMAPFYRGYQSNFKLDQDDIRGIQAIYGAATRQTTSTVSPRVTTESSKPRPPAGLCRSPKIDAITRTKNGLTYVFIGLKYYRLNDAGVESGYPKYINLDWHGVSGHVDAVLTVPSGNTYIFKGDKYWKFVNLVAASGYPRRISQGFPGIPADLDAAFIWSGNGQPYFVKDNKYWRYSFSTYSVATGYPRSMVNWRNLPISIDGVFQWKNDRTYFFKDDKYYRFNDRDFEVDAGYPRDTAEWWFGCSGVKDSQPINNNPPSIHEVQNNDNQYSGPVVVDKDDTPSIWASSQGDGDSNSAQYITSLSLITQILIAGLIRLFL